MKQQHGDDMQQQAHQASVPTYKLFGEQEPWPTPEMLHCESIAARSASHNWQITPHRHSGLFQILYLAAGSAEVHSDGASKRLLAGQLMLVPQMCIHGFRFEKNAQGCVVTVAYPLIGRLAPPQAVDALMALSSPAACTLGDDDTYLPPIFNALEAEYRGAAPYRNALVEALLASILIVVARHCSQAVVAAEAPARRGGCFPAYCELIERHYAEHKPVSFYAGKLGVTAAHLNALCKQAVSRSALEMLHERMILEAKRNLIYTSMTVSVVADTAGFSDPAYFTRFFKREVGMSPTEFRQKAGTLQV
jgi:AraC family transcriptional activator of pobA